MTQIWSVEMFGLPEVDRARRPEQCHTREREPTSTPHTATRTSNAAADDRGRDRRAGRDTSSSTAIGAFGVVPASDRRLTSAAAWSPPTNGFAAPCTCCMRGRDEPRPEADNERRRQPRHPTRSRRRRVMPPREHRRHERPPRRRDDDRSHHQPAELLHVAAAGRGCSCWLRNLTSVKPSTSPGSSRPRTRPRSSRPTADRARRRGSR